jgi:hypothetical protein
MKLSSAHGPKMPWATPAPQVASGQLLRLFYCCVQRHMRSGATCGARPSACPACHSTEARSASLLLESVVENLAITESALCPKYGENVREL